VHIPDLPTLNLEAPTISIPRAGGGSSAQGSTAAEELRFQRETRGGGPAATQPPAFDMDAFMRALAGLLGGGGGGGVGGGGGGGALGVASDLQQLQGAFEDWQKNNPTGQLSEFVARLELAQEGILAVSAATNTMQDEAFRGQVELHKLSIVLGDMPGDVFIAQQGLVALAEAFRSSGQSIDEFVDNLHGFTKTLLDQARDLAKSSKQPINTVSVGGGTGLLIPGTNIKFAYSGNLTDEGLARARKNNPVLDAILSGDPGAVRRTDPQAELAKALRDAVEKPRTTYNGPVYNTYNTGPDRTLKMGLR